MNRYVLFAAFALTGAALLCASGCTPPGKSLVAAKQVAVDTQSSGGVHVSRVDVYQDGETLLVEGLLRRSPALKTRSVGHVDVSVVGPDGSMLAKKSLRRIWRHCSSSTGFAAKLALVPPEGSTVRVSVHDGRHPADPDKNNERGG